MSFGCICGEAGDLPVLPLHYLLPAHSCPLSSNSLQWRQLLLQIPGVSFMKSLHMETYMCISFPFLNVNESLVCMCPWKNIKGQNTQLQPSFIISCGMRDLRSSLWDSGSSSLTRDQPRSPALAVGTLGRWTTREACTSFI